MRPIRSLLALLAIAIMSTGCGGSSNTPPIIASYTSLPPCANGQPRNSIGLCTASHVRRAPTVTKAANGATLTFDQTDENTAATTAASARTSSARGAQQTNSNALVIGIYPSTGTVAPENCWTYTPNYNQTSVASHLTSSLSSSQLASELGIDASIQAKYLLFSASDAFKYDANSQSSSTSFSSIWKLNVTTQVGTTITGLNNPVYGKAAPQAFAQVCGTAVMTNYTASGKVYVTFTISNQSATQSQKIKDDFNAKYGSFVNAMVSISSDSSISKAQTNVSASFLALGLSPAESAFISSALGGTNYAQCTSFQNTATSCAAFDADLNAAMGKIQTQIAADFTNGTASYLYVDTSPLAITTLGAADLPLYGAPSGISNVFKAYESTLGTDSSVAMDLLTLQALASTYQGNPNFSVLPEGTTTLTNLTTQYANAAVGAVATLDSCLDNAAACGSLPTFSINSTVTNPTALANAYLWALDFQMSDPVQGFVNVQALPLITGSDVLFALPSGFTGGSGLAQATNSTVTSTAPGPQAPYLMQLTMNYPISQQQAQPATFTALMNDLTQTTQYAWPFLQPYVGSAQRESYTQGAPIAPPSVYQYGGALIAGPICNPTSFACSGTYSSQTSASWNAPGLFSLPLSITVQPNTVLQTIGQANPSALSGQ